MFPQYTVVACFNDTPSQQTMSGYSQASLIYSNTSYLIYMWTAATQTDADTLGDLFNNAGSPGYPMAGMLLPNPS